MQSQRAQLITNEFKFLDKLIEQVVKIGDLNQIFQQGYFLEKFQR